MCRFCFHSSGKILRRISCEPHFLAGTGMLESYFPGMQHLPGKNLLFSTVSAILIDRVPQQRMVHGIKVHPDLVGTAGMELHTDKAGTGKSPAYLPGCMGGFSGFMDDSHALAVLRVPADRKRYVSCIRKRCACHQRQIRLFHPVVLKLFLQKIKAVRCSGHKHKSAGVFVQAMDNAGAQRVIPHIFDLWIMEKQSVHKGMALAACPGVNHQARDFVQDQDMGICIHHRHRPGFRRHS